MEKKKLEIELSQIEDLYSIALHNNDEPELKRLSEIGRSIQKKIEYIEGFEEAHEDDFNKADYEDH